MAEVPRPASSWTQRGTSTVRPYLGASLIAQFLAAVFKLAPDGTETVLYSFCPLSHCPDGSFPSGLVMDAAGNLYGTTQEGGISPFVGGGAGVVFKLAPNGTYTVRYSFCPQNGCADGSHPGAGLIIDGAGNLYGTTYQGRTNNNGVVFQLAPDGTYTVLYNFCQQSNCADGANPLAGLVMDAAGNLYGTTYQGGTSGHNAGTVFRSPRTGHTPSFTASAR